MALAYRTKATSTYAAADPKLLEVTTQAGDALLVLGIIGGANDARTGGAPTWNSGAQTFTQVSSGVVGTAECYVELWYLASPGAATANISVPNTGSLSLKLIASVFTGTGATLFGDNESSTDADDPSLTIVGVPAGSAVVDIMGHGHKDAMTASDTLLYTTDEGIWQSGAQYAIRGTTGDETFTWTTAGSDDVAWLMGAWEESAAANPQTAETAVAVAAVAQPSVTGQYQAELQAGTAAAAAGVAAPAVTALAQVEVTAGTAPGLAAVAQPAVTASYALEVSAGVSAAVAAIAQPAVTVAAYAPFAVNSSTGVMTIADPGGLLVGHTWQVVVRVTDNVSATDDGTITVQLVAGGETAGVSVAVAAVSQPAITATGLVEVSAGVAVATAGVSQPAVTATHLAEFSAGTAAAAASVAQPSVTGTSVVDVTAGTAAAVAMVTQPATTAQYQSLQQAGTTVAVAAVAQPPVTGESSSYAGVGVSELVISQPAVTASYQSELSAGLAAAIAGVSQPGVTPTWEIDAQAALSPLVASVAQPAVTAQYTGAGGFKAAWAVRRRQVIGGGVA